MMIYARILQQGNSLDLVFHEDSKYYPKLFQMSVCINYQKKNGKMATKFFDSIIVLRFGKTKVAKKNLMMQKKKKKLGC